MSASPLSATWLGHGTFLFRTPGGRHILLDPWLAGNPACPADRKVFKGPLDLILVTHGHSDHIEDAAAIAQKTGALVVGIFEVCQWLAQQGAPKTSGMNKGGTQHVHGIAITMVDALHSSSYAQDGTAAYLGEAAGYVLRFENGQTVYFAGDTALFGDMRLIQELYKPQVAFLPIGDHFTMGPDQAARAAEFLGVGRVVPMHYGTFPLLTGTPAQLRALVHAKGIEVLDVQPGQSLELG
jgi:L-ascorbate metabolism protein UlaG (beta-lactamase superfamily)